MKVLPIIVLGSLALHFVSAKNLVKRDCGQDCDSPCNSGCSSSSCNTQPCHNNCNDRPCRSNCNSRPCNNNRNCNQQPCNVEEPEEKVPVLIPFPQNQQPNIQPAENSVNNTNISNSTTTITLTNTINTVNNISVPISLNSTNENTISVHFDANGAPGVVERRSIWDNITSECCIVTSPVNCQDDGKNCSVERRWECSDICRGVLPDIREPVAQLTARNISARPIVVNTSIPVYQPRYQVIYQYQPVRIPTKPIVVQQPVVQQPAVQQPIFVQQPVQQPLTIQQPMYQPVPRQQVYMQVPVARPVERQAVPRTVVQQVPIFQTAYRPTVESGIRVVKEGEAFQPSVVQSNQGALTRVLVVPYSNYYGGSYQGNIQSGYPWAYASAGTYQTQQQHQQYVMSTMEGPCPYSSPDDDDIAYPTPCQQSRMLS